MDRRPRIDTSEIQGGQAVMGSGVNNANRRFREVHAVILGNKDLIEKKREGVIVDDMERELFSAKTNANDLWEGKRSTPSGAGIPDPLPTGKHVNEDELPERPATQPKAVDRPVP